MTKNNQDYDDGHDEAIDPNILSQKALSILKMFGEDDRQNVIELMHGIDEDRLSYDSLKASLDEHQTMGSLGTGMMLVSRENFDLREKVRKERRFNILTLMGLVVCLAIIAILLYMFTVYPKYRVVQTVDNSVICEIDPSDNPQLTDVAIQDFAKTAVLSAYSFDYVNYRDQINNATTRYFTPDGRAAFNTALRSSGSLDHIIANNLIMKSMTLQSPQIEEKGLDSRGKPYWIVRMPIATEFYTGTAKAADVQSFVAQVRVVNTQRDAFNPRGLGVLSMTLRPYKANN